MNATTTTRKQTAGNNATLAHLKRWLNVPLYKVAADAMNDGGIEAVRAVLARHFEPIPTCPRCGERKVAGTECFGDDECIYGPDGGKDLCCEGWGRYCCRCGADYARSQMG